MAAADWIKMRTELYRDPQVCIIADHLTDPARHGSVTRDDTRDDTLRHGVTNVSRNVMRHAVIGALLAVWGVMRHAGKRDGHDLFCSRATLSIVDDIAEMPGLGAAMKAAGWLDEREDGILFPNFFNGLNVDPATDHDKTSAERSRRHRAKKKAENVTLRHAVTSRSGTHREREREEKEKELSKSKSCSTQTDSSMTGDPPPDADTPPSVCVPTTAGLACKAMRQAGIATANSTDPRLLEALAMGATPDEFAEAAADAVAKHKPNFPYVLGIVLNRRREAAALAANPLTATPSRARTHGKLAPAERVIEIIKRHHAADERVEPDSGDWPDDGAIDAEFRQLDAG